MLDKPQSEKEEIVNIQTLSEITGLPVALIKDELFTEGFNEDSLSMDSLRAAMLKYLDKTMT